MLRPKFHKSHTFPVTRDTISSDWKQLLNISELWGLAIENNLPIEDDSLSISHTFNPLSAGDAFKRIHTVFPQPKFDRN